LSWGCYRLIRQGAEGWRQGATPGQPLVWAKPRRGAARLNLETTHRRRTQEVSSPKLTRQDEVCADSVGRR
jgi:hypothetical protein